IVSRPRQGLARNVGTNALVHGGLTTPLARVGVDERDIGCGEMLESREQTLGLPHCTEGILHGGDLGFEFFLVELRGVGVGGEQDGGGGENRGYEEGGQFHVGARLGERKGCARRTRRTAATTGWTGLKRWPASPPRCIRRSRCARIRCAR